MNIGYDKLCRPGIEIETWCGNVNDELYKQVGKIHNVSFHCLEVINLRGIDCCIKAKSNINPENVIFFKKILNDSEVFSWENSFKVNRRSFRGKIKSNTIKKQASMRINTDLIHIYFIDYACINTYITYTYSNDMRYFDSSLTFNIKLLWE